MISVGAGLFAGGKIPFANSFAKFIARAVDQIDMAGISRANLKIVGSHAGVSLGADGPSPGRALRSVRRGPGDSGRDRDGPSRREATDRPE